MIELHCINALACFDFTISNLSKKACVVDCSKRTAMALIQRCGSFFKIVKILGAAIDDALHRMEIPDEPKFNWTISSYGVDSEESDFVKAEVQSYLKSKMLGKSRYMQPEIQTSPDDNSDDNWNSIQELKLKTLHETILFPKKGKIPSGIDFVILRNDQGTLLYGQTTASSDVLGFEKRDLSRSYQDPTITMSPRLARILVNLGMTTFDHGTLLDPFCGLGTILQEGMLLGYNVVGVDISSSNVERTKANLDWINKTNPKTSKLGKQIIRRDSLRLSKKDIPKINGIASEPILVPKYGDNPTTQDALESLDHAKSLYSQFLTNAHSLLDKGSRIAIVSPAIIDKTGKEHRLMLNDALEQSGFRKLEAPGGVQYPLRVESSKKRIVQRDVYVIVAN